jgi:hypothetical protein
LIDFSHDFRPFTPSDARSRPPSLILFSLGRMQRVTLVTLIAAACLFTLVHPAAVAKEQPELYTLSSWKSRIYHKWDFALVSKTYWYTAGSVAELKQQLSKLPPGSSIEWYTRPGTDFVYPPQPMFSDIRRFLSEHHFKLVFTHTPRKL